MNKVRNNLFVGGWNDAKNRQTLKDNGITAILNLAADCDDPDYSPSIKQIKIGLQDKRDNKPYLIDLAVMALKAMLSNGETVLVHCMSGASRAPYIVAKAIADIDVCSFTVAWDEVVKARPQAAGKSLLDPS